MTRQNTVEVAVGMASTPSAPSLKFQRRLRSDIPIVPDRFGPGGWDIHANATFADATYTRIGERRTHPFRPDVPDTYICSLKLLHTTLQLRALPRVLFAGRISGIEGYTEATATAMIAGMNAARLARD